MPGIAQQTKSPLAGLTDAQIQQLDAYVRRKVAESRGDPVTFYDFCYWDLSNVARTASPHHELALRFIDHFQYSVLRMPTGAGKTSVLRMYALWRVGRSHQTMRGAFVSAAQSQAKGPVDVMRRMIEESPQVQAVFPHLVPTPDPSLPWRPDAFTVRRPAELGNPTMAALGMDAAIPGKRWTDAYCDDVLSVDNTASKEARDALYLKFDTQVISRLDRQGAKLVVSNTPWDRDDLTYSLEQRAAYPTLTMGGDGTIKFGGDLGGDAEELFGDLVRPASRRQGTFRLVKNGPDAREALSLWPQEFTAEYVKKLKQRTLPHALARIFYCEPMDAASSRCSREWTNRAIERGKGHAIPMPGTRGVTRRFTGVDVGGLKKGDDLSSIVTVELRPSEHRVLLNVQSGHWAGPELRDRIIREAQLYDSTVFVESNSAQKYFKGFAEEKAAGVRIVNFTTTAMTKNDVNWGVEALFAELMRGLWTWPGLGHPEVEALADECVFYNPAQHTGDRLMALFLARQGVARSSGRAASTGAAGPSIGFGGSF